MKRRRHPYIPSIGILKDLKYQKLLSWCELKCPKDVDAIEGFCIVFITPCHLGYVKVTVSTLAIWPVTPETSEPERAVYVARSKLLHNRRIQTGRPRAYLFFHRRSCWRLLVLFANQQFGCYGNTTHCCTSYHETIIIEFLSNSRISFLRKSTSWRSPAAKSVQNKAISVYILRQHNKSQNMNFEPGSGAMSAVTAGYIMQSMASPRSQTQHTAMKSLNYDMNIRWSDHISFVHLSFMQFAILMLNNLVFYICII